MFNRLNIKRLLLFILLILCVFSSSCSKDEKTTQTVCGKISAQTVLATDPVSLIEKEYMQFLEDNSVHWEILAFDEIKGFEYEKGFEYRLSILKTKIKPLEDQSIYQYKLIEITSKKKTTNRP